MPNEVTVEGLSWGHHFPDHLPGETAVRAGSRQVHGALWSGVQPTPVADPTLLAWSPEVASLLGMTESTVRSETFASVFGGNRVLGTMKPWAACYGGHQFGNWAGQLGDGRALSLGDLPGVDGTRYEIQLKGAGPTPYSRTADGRAVLRSSVREFLCSEAMFHLGVPTTRALSLIGTGDDVVRDMLYDGHPAPEPGAIVCRVAPSFLRFGSFELPASRGDVDTLSRLVDYTLTTHFPELGPLSKESTLAMLHEVARRTGFLMAEWMRVGFVHGVMNTDNLSILGLTIDYGPYGWLEPYELDWTPNTTDAGRRRYRFGQQPQVAIWNLVRLAEALHPIVQDVPALEAALEGFETAWTTHRRANIRAKLGLSTAVPERDDPLWSDLVGLLTGAETDMTRFFRALGEVDLETDPTDAALLAPLTAALYAPMDPRHEAPWLAWMKRWMERARADQPQVARHEQMRLANPRYVLRNWIAQEVIDAATEGDLGLLGHLQDVLRRPYDDQPGAERFDRRRPEWARNRAGCSMLSCSS